MATLFTKDLAAVAGRRKKNHGRYIASVIRICVFSLIILGPTLFCAASAADEDELDRKLDQLTQLIGTQRAEIAALEKKLEQQEKKHNDHQNEHNDAHKTAHTKLRENATKDAIDAVKGSITQAKVAADAASTTAGEALSVASAARNEGIFYVWGPSGTSCVESCKGYRNKECLIALGGEQLWYPCEHRGGPRRCVCRP